MIGKSRAAVIGPILEGVRCCWERPHVPEYADRVVGVVIPPFLMGLSRRIQAAASSFIAGAMPPMPMLGRSLL